MSCALPGPKPVEKTTILALSSPLLCKIASFLPQADATSFSQTCSAFHTPGIASFWSEVDITYPSPRDERRRGLVRTCTTAPTLPNSDHKVALIFLLYRMQTCNVQQYVRSIVYDISTLLPLGGVLRIVSPTLVHLEVKGHIAQGASEDRYLLESSFMTFTLKALRTFDLALDERWENRVRKLLPRTPNLRTLRLRPSLPYAGGWGDRFHFQHPLSKMDWPVLDMLETLEIEHMSSALTPFIVSLLQGSSRIKRVVLRDPSNDWCPLTDDPLLEALANSPQLQYLGIKWRVMWVIKDSPGFKNVKMLSLDETPGPMIFRHLGVSQAILLFSDLQGIRLGNFPSLERLFLYPTTFTCDPTWFWRFGGEVVFQPSKIEAIPKLLIDILDNSPNLTLIQQMVDEESEFTGNDWDDLAKKSQESDYAFLLISQYRLNAENLYHLRSYSARDEYEHRRRIYHARDVWLEYLDYNGQSIPADLLGRLYKAMGTGTAWMHPRRHVELPQSGAQVLQNWVKQEKQRKEDPFWID